MVRTTPDDLRDRIKYFQGLIDEEKAKAEPDTERLGFLRSHRNEAKHMLDRYESRDEEELLAEEEERRRSRGR